MLTILKIRAVKIGVDAETSVDVLTDLYVRAPFHYGTEQMC
jgi:hypothetical protein